MSQSESIIHAIRSAGFELKWEIEIPESIDDSLENGGKKYRIEAIDERGHLQIVRSPFLTDGLTQMAIKLGFDLEG